ncbi:MAG: hypothetical protein PHQ95_00470 [Candidatus Gracilibacteria bacterium]|nr:hypothetical protein [Candidatus Gracilibacteria bacterium]
MKNANYAIRAYLLVFITIVTIGFTYGASQDTTVLNYLNSLRSTDPGLPNVPNQKGQFGYILSTIFGTGTLEGKIKQEYLDLSGIGGGSSVTSVNTRTGSVVLTKADVGLGNVDDTSDVNKPISTATQTALNLKAPLVSPALTGTPTATTPNNGDNSTRIATTAWVAANTASAAGTSYFGCYMNKATTNSTTNFNASCTTGYTKVYSVIASNGPVGYTYEVGYPQSTNVLFSLGGTVSISMAPKYTISDSLSCNGYQTGLDTYRNVVTLNGSAIYDDCTKNIPYNIMYYYSYALCCK